MRVFEITNTPFLSHSVIGKEYIGQGITAWTEWYKVCLKIYQSGIRSRADIIICAISLISEGRVCEQIHFPCVYSIPSTHYSLMQPGSVYIQRCEGGRDAPGRQVQSPPQGASNVGFRFFRVKALLLFYSTKKVSALGLNPRAEDIKINSSWYLQECNTLLSTKFFTF